MIYTLDVIQNLSKNNYTFWWVALGIGLVVILVVVVLLSLLVSFVKDIDAEVGRVLEGAGRVAANTTTLPQLDTTAVAAEALEAEVKNHVALLGKLAPAEEPSGAQPAHVQAGVM